MTVATPTSLKDTVCKLKFVFDKLLLSNLHRVPYNISFPECERVCRNRVDNCRVLTLKVLHSLGFDIFVTAAKTDHPSAQTHHSY